MVCISKLVWLSTHFSCVLFAFSCYRRKTLGVLYSACYNMASHHHMHLQIYRHIDSLINKDEENLDSINWFHGQRCNIVEQSARHLPTAHLSIMSSVKALVLRYVAIFLSHICKTLMRWIDMMLISWVLEVNNMLAVLPKLQSTNRGKLAFCPRQATSK